ncbi:MAG: helix-turn-helix domain-containing protein [Oceanococcaceae bacterium]
MAGPTRRSPGGNRGSKSKNSKHPNDTAAQRQRILRGLREAGGKGLTTVDMRRQLDIMEPHARLHELRWTHGHNIASTWTVDTTEAGHEHRVCRYYLMPGKWKGVAA